MLGSKDVLHQCPCICVRSGWEEEASFFQASDPMDSLSDISLEYNLDEDLLHILLCIPPLSLLFLPMFHGRCVLRWVL